jgi:hypothetical protein
VSGGWAVGVLLPFGPLFFRLNYPDQARRSYLFRLATLPCFFLYILLGPGPVLKQRLYKTTQISAQPGSYGMERKSQAKGKTAGPTVEVAPNPEDLRRANIQRFEHLRAWNESLRLKKRDLLRSDTKGNAAYTLELADYNAALATATAERAALWPGTK